MYRQSIFSRIGLILFLYTVLCCFVVEDVTKITKATFTDSRDGKVYSIARLTNGLLWMTENLSYDVEGSNCEDDKPKNCKKFGRLYTRSESKVACPSGWRLPSKDEFEELIRRSGSGAEAIYALSTGGSSGFDAKLFGYWQGRRPIDSGRYGFYWSNEDYNAGGYMMMLESIPGGRKSARVEYTESDTDELSCRCVRRY